MDLVEVKGKDVFCDSGIVSRCFKMKHADVVRAMETLIPKLEDFRVAGCHPKAAGFDPQFSREQRTYRGTDYTAYLLNRDCFMLLAMRFDTKTAREWQGKFIAAFNLMEQRILDVDVNATDPKWLTQRSQGKLARREETDIIKDFVEYATNQGSKSAKFYYKHITTATYKALGLMVQAKPKLRDTMDFYELSELLLAERVAMNSLKKYMDLGRHYKDIYNSVRDDLTVFGSALQTAGKG